MWHAVSSQRYDLIHLHAIPPGVFAALPRLRGIPLVSTIQGLDWQRAKWKGLGSKVIKHGERTIVRNARRMIVVSRDLKNYYQKEYGRVSSHIPNGVEIAPRWEHEAAEVLNAYDLKPNDYFLFLARLVPEKRTDDLLRAYMKLGTEKKLVIAGESGYTDGYVAELKRLASSDRRIFFVGFQREKAVHALLGNASGFVLPSEIEGLPVALLEAMSHGTIPIVSSIPPHRELLGGIPGYDLFFAPRDIDGLASCLNRLLSSPDYYKRLGRDIRRFAEANFGWDALTTLTESVYYDALEGDEDRSFDFAAGSEA
jgi:glycosyltransferase involved in cell wall biosynthesis